MVNRVRELEVKYRNIRRTLPAPVGRVNTPQDAVLLSAALLADSPVERVLALHLNVKHELIGVHRVSVGCLDAALVHPREVFQAAILSNASGIIVAHNHPSGDPTPSPDDIALVQRLAAASRVIGIDLLDAIIVGDSGRFYSFQSNGTL
jgi:DNA repair protein RadC